MKKTIITLIIGLALLAALFYTMGINSVLSVLYNTDPYLFIYAGIALLAMEFFLCLKLKILVPAMSLKETFLSHQGGMFFSDMTPGKAGYFYTAYSIAKKTQTSISERLGIITLIQGLMMVTKIIVLVIAFVYLSFIIQLPLVFLVAFAVPVSIVALVFFILYTKTSHTVLSRIPILRKATKYLELMQSAVANISRGAIIKILIIDAVCWVFTGLQFYFLGAAIGMHIGLVMSILVAQLLSVLMFIPISPAGLGVTEGGSVLLFILLGFTAPQAISIILLWRINSIIFDGLTGMWDLKTVKLPEKWSL